MTRPKNGSFLPAGAAALYAFLAITSCGRGRGEATEGLSRAAPVSSEASEKARALLRRGVQFMADSQDDEAVKVLEQARTVDPSSPALAIALGRAYQRVDKYAAAHQILEAVLGSAIASAGQKTEARTVLVETLLWEGNLDRAREVGAALLSEARDSADSHRLAGMIAYREGNLEAARSELLEAVRIHPSDSEALTQLGLVQLAAGDSPAAVKSLEEATRLEPESLPALTSLARAYERLGQGEKADAARARLKLAYDQKSIRHNLAPLRSKGMQAYDAGRLDEALESFQAMLKLSPRDPQVLAQISTILLAMQRLEEAERYLARSLEIRPDNDLALTELGRLYALRNDLPRAIQMFGRATQVNPSAPEPHYYLAGIYFAQRRKDDFLRERAEYERLRPNSSGGLMPLPGEGSR
ncbi:MAG TPA: tetratricopeptide repeat protein [Candidatus Polarisedimenticolia bacterium]|nr:tetratricopeptide repeat protein [Candidatus Polarisedimenticolia bacterium]